MFAHYTLLLNNFNNRSYLFSFKTQVLNFNVLFRTFCIPTRILFFVEVPRYNFHFHKYLIETEWTHVMLHGGGDESQVCPYGHDMRPGLQPTTVLQPNLFLNRSFFVFPRL